MRKLVTVRKITDIKPIPNADFIEEVWVDGWSVVCQKGVHKVDNFVVYFELDSFLPESDKRFESFMKFGTRTFDGVVGHRIKTVRLKGVYSQGVIMPISEFPELGGVLDAERDYSEDLGIVKWEAPEFTGKAGKFGDAKGNFPWFLRKTDQERIQNLYDKLIETHQDADFVGTLKMDGSSIQVGYVGNERFGEPRVFICSRNLELRHDPDADIETQGCFIKGAVYSDLFNKAKELYDITGVSYSIQGELVGNGIQGNFEKFEDYQVFAYNIFNIDTQDYVSFHEFESLCDLVGIQTVPVVYCKQPVLRNSLQDILTLSNMQGLRAEYCEGVVWKSVHGTTQFKVINNFYLEKQK